MEVVTLSSDERSAAISGRVKVSLWLKFNPIWWFFNDAEQKLAQAEWYNSDLPQWQRALLWHLRNPLQNFRAFVAGVADKNYTVRGRPPVMTVQRNDLFAPETGWQWCVLAGGDLWFPRFFVSYSGKRVVWYFGHQPTGWRHRNEKTPRPKTTDSTCGAELEMPAAYVNLFHEVESSCDSATSDTASLRVLAPLRFPLVAVCDCDIVSIR